MALLGTSKVALALYVYAEAKGSPYQCSSHPMQELWSFEDTEGRRRLRTAARRWRCT